MNERTTYEGFEFELEYEHAPHGWVAHVYDDNGDYVSTTTKRRDEGDAIDDAYTEIQTLLNER